MNLGNLDFLYLFLILPGYYLFYRNNAFRKEVKRNMFADKELHQAIITPYISTEKRRDLFIVLLILFLLIFSLLQPQWGFSWKKAQRKGLDIVIALDVSESMLAKDVSPSRLERAKRKIIDLIDTLKGDRVALVSFAGTAYVECPLTLDYQSYKIFLNSVSTDSVPIKGTNIETALSKSLEVLKVSSSINPDLEKDRAIILITDGEELEGDFKKISKIAAASNVHVYILGVGTKEGSPISTPRGYRMDKEGKVIITRLKEDVLRKLALDTGGIYVQSISSDQDTEALYSQGIKKMLQDSDLSEEEVKKWNEYYQWPLFLALIVILFGHWGLKIFFSFKPKLLLGLFLLSSIFTQQIVFAQTFPQLQTAERFQTVEKLGKNAKIAFDKADYPVAKEKFAEARKKSENDVRLLLGEASADYRLGDFPQAQAIFFEAATKAKTEIEKAAVLYNAGNSFVMQNKFEEAIKTYEDSLKLNPNDQEAKDNLEYAKKKLADQKQQAASGKDQNEEREKEDQNPEQQAAQEKNQNENQEKKEQENKEQEKNKEEEQQKQNSKPEENKKGEEEKENKADLKKDGSEEQGKEGEVSEKQFDQLLESIDEKSQNRLKYRYQKALEALRKNKERIPEKDW